jgi:hypothetical protein
MKIYNDAEYQAVIHELKKGRDGDYSVRIYNLMYWWKLTEEDIDFIVVMAPGDDYDTPDPEREYLIDPNEFFSAIENAFDYPYFSTQFSIVFKDGSRINSVPGFDADFVQFDYIPPIRKPSKQAHLKTMINWKGKKYIEETLEDMAAYKLDELGIHSDDDRFEETKDKIISEIMEECDIDEEALDFEERGF